VYLTAPHRHIPASPWAPGFPGFVKKLLPLEAK
jgi:hypothetical protein